VVRGRRGTRFTEDAALLAAEAGASVDGAAHSPTHAIGIVSRMAALVVPTAAWYLFLRDAGLYMHFVSVWLSVYPSVCLCEAALYKRSPTLRFLTHTYNILR